MPPAPARALAAPTLPVTPVLRRCACGGKAPEGGECEECRARRMGLRRSATSAAAPGFAPPLVHEVLRSPGRPLDAGTRAWMEPRFGHSFADVRVHADGRAARSADAVSARAYAVGRDIVFGAGAYAPGSTDGRRLVAHELAHVVQQSASLDAAVPMASLEIGSADAPEERAAEAAAERVMAGGAAGAPAPAFVYISPLPPEDAPPLPRALAALPVRWGSHTAERAGVAGLVEGGAVHLAPVAERLPGPALARLLAHEAAHLAQAAGGRTRGTRADVEIEARGGEDALLAGRAFRPRFRPGPGVPLHQTPHDTMVVERARSRLALLEEFQGECITRMARRTQTGAERQAGQEARQRLDESMADPFADPEARQAMEDAQVRALNRRPLEVLVTEDEVRFRIRFHARFEDAGQEGRFDELVSTLQAGIDLVWNQRLQGASLGGRRFVVEPVVTLVPATATRDHAAWLIHVRAADDAPVTYPGCSLDEVPEGIPTSVTDPACDGGVMNIPPRHVALPGVLGHELMHLFGLVDRYRLVTSEYPDGTVTHRQDRLRETGGRGDPLGGDDAPVLAEDLAFILDRFGVYELEEGRGLETLRALEAQGMSCGIVAVEIARQQDIIRLGRDPRSLIRPRTDFIDEMMRDAENL
ncbi:MAG TPA: DUF4157 domain-containing protein [Longimicrobium sp.]|nr:DUF4157 domain-containing protein [Longimicrobium sp.]